MGFLFCKWHLFIIVMSVQTQMQYLEFMLRDREEKICAALLFVCKTKLLEIALKTQMVQFKFRRLHLQSVHQRQMQMEFSVGVLLMGSME